MEESTLKKTLSKLVILSSLGITAFMTPVLSAEASYDQGIKETTQKLNQLESKEKSAQAQLEELTKTISATAKKSEELIAEIQETTAQLEALQEEIDALTKAIAAREEKLQQQARAVQVTGDATNVLQFIVEADSFADILGRVDMVTQLLGANKDLVEQQVLDQEAVRAKEAETEKKQETQMQLAAELESKKADLEQQQAEQEVLVASIASEKAQVAEQRDAYVAQRAAAESRVREMQEARTAASQTSARSTADTSVAPEQKTEAAASVAPPAASGSVISNAYSVQGTRYSYGGSSTSGFDCSGFTSYAYSKAGKSLPRTARGQYSSSTRISMAQAQPGDLVFFNQTGTIDHVGIYLGNGQFIGSQSSTGVAVASVTSGYWANKVVGFGRK